MVDKRRMNQVDLKLKRMHKKNEMEDEMDTSHINKNKKKKEKDKRYDQIIYRV